LPTVATRRPGRGWTGQPNAASGDLPLLPAGDTNLKQAPNTVSNDAQFVDSLLLLISGLQKHDNSVIGHLF
jgi:hypothetical protein